MPRVYVIDPECLSTFEMVRDELQDVERRLAQRLKIRRAVRRELFALDRCGKLVEDELVNRWHELYASYIDYVREAEQRSLPVTEAREE
jgi:hypothetical protein